MSISCCIVTQELCLQKLTDSMLATVNGPDRCCLKQCLFTCAVCSSQYTYDTVQQRQTLCMHEAYTKQTY